jgi:curved DNA-binding protein CbpA
MLKVEPRPPVDSGARVSLAELGKTWHVILGVDAGATSDEIEAAYHARLAECDRTRFSSAASSLEKQSAETQRGRVNEAYEFIRSIKHA